MRKYWEIAKSQIKINAAYSAWFWASMVSSLFRLLIVYFFWHAVYANRTTLSGLSLDTMITYLVVAMMLGTFFFAGAGTKLAEYIRDGSVAIELMRPYDLLMKLLFLDLGEKISGVVQNVIPLLVIAYVFLGVHLPAAGIGGALLFLLSAALGIVLSTVFSLLFGVLAFWTVNLFWLNLLRNGIQMFFTGSLIPITLFPGWLQTMSNFLPFQSMVYVPSAIYTGTISGNAVWAAIGMQVVWLVVVYVVVRLIWSVALRRVTIFGG
ncbi:MAG: ABC transporter permease [Tumebacillaceae bacterium]